MKKVMCLFLLLLANKFLLAEKVTVSGIATGYEGKSVSIITFKDFLSMSREVIAKSSVGDDGKFTISAEVDEICYSLVKIGNVSSIIYLQPGSSYSISFPLPDDKTARSLDETKVEMYFDSLDAYDINNLIIDFDYRYDYFMTKNMLILHKPEFKLQLDTFKQKITKVYKEIKVPFFIDYVYYSTAMLELMGDMENGQMMAKASVYEQYIRGKKIGYHHDKYMALFNEFYSEPFSNLSPEINERMLVAVNEKASMKSLFNAIEKNSFTSNQNVRELIIIKGLMENYYNKEYDPENILVILDSIANHGINEDNRKVAATVYKKLTYLSKGYDAPDFKLTTLKGDTISLSQFKGKFVYLSFWSSWNTTSVSELKLYPGYIKRYGDPIVYISVNMDEKKSDFSDFMKKHPEYNWYFLDGHSDNEIMDLYQIKSLPLYYLIDEEGKFRQAPALRPSPNGTFKSIDETFHNIYWNKKRQGKN
jgi:thiol-disulfide isomerase/thioredoxin